MEEEKIKKIENLTKTYELLNRIISLEKKIAEIKNGIALISVGPQNSYEEFVDNNENKMELRKKLKYLVKVFEKNLGLKIVKNRNNKVISFVFEKVSEENHKGEISLGYDNGFYLASCKPFLPCIDPILDELNEIEDFARFFSSVRKQFVAKFSSNTTKLA